MLSVDCRHPDAVEAREKFLKPAAFASMVAMGDLELSCRGLFRHPASDTVGPATEGGISRFDLTEGLVEDLVPTIVAIDGSCSRTGIVDCERATWALRTYNSSLQALTVVSGPVWHPTPATAPASEHAALCAAKQIAVSPLLALGDCENVVTQNRLPLSLQLSGKKKYAGFFRQALQYPGRDFVNLEKVTAHKSSALVDDPDEKFLIDCNNAVDQDAKDARITAHPDGVCTDIWRRQFSSALLLSRTIGAILACWPKNPKPNRPVGPRRAGANNLGLVIAHDWIQVGGSKGIWRCAECLTFALSSAGKEKRNWETCKPESAKMLVGMAEGTGHQLLAASHRGAPIFFCFRCGCRSERKTRELRRPCKGKTSGSRRWVLADLMNGVHPVTKEALADAPFVEDAFERWAAVYGYSLPSRQWS